MTELLKRWAELEPERITAGPRGFYFPAPQNVTIHWPELEHELAPKALVLGAVIEAIEARGWDWNLTGMLPWGATARHYTGTVAYHVRESDSPAAALLAAYVAALEVEAGQ